MAKKRRKDPRPCLITPFNKQYTAREWEMLTALDEFTFVLKDVGSIATEVGESPDDISFRVDKKGGGWVCLERHDRRADAEFGRTATTRSQFSCAKHALAYHLVVPQSPIAPSASTPKKQRKQQAQIFGGSSAFIQLKTPEAQEANVVQQLERSKEKQAREQTKAPYVPSVIEEPDENDRNARFQRSLSAHNPGCASMLPEEQDDEADVEFADVEFVQSLQTPSLCADRGIWGQVFQTHE